MAKVRDGIINVLRRGLNARRNQVHLLGSSTHPLTNRCFAACRGRGLVLTETATCVQARDLKGKHNQRDCLPLVCRASAIELIVRAGLSIF